MKTIMGIMMLACLSLVASNGADAQRRGHDSGGGGRQSNAFSRGNTRSFSSGRSFNSGNTFRQNNTVRPNITFRQNNSYRQNTSTPVQRNERVFSTTTVQRNRSYSFPQRNAITRNDVRVNNNMRFNTYSRVNTPSNTFNRNRVYPSTGNRVYSSRTYVNNNYNRYNRFTGYHYDRRYYGGGYYYYNNRRYSFMYGHRYTYIPRSFLSISFGGINYWYNDGCFWGWYGGYYQPIFPPFGLHIGILPYRYYSFYWGGYPYYYYNGIYYRYYNDYYEVVDAPVGAVVYSLPAGVRTVVINGETMYELNGTYYKQGIDANGRTTYTVIGKYGVVNNTEDNGVITTPDNSTPDNSSDYNDNGYDQNNNVVPDNNQTNAPTLQMGDEVSELPDGSKAVVIKGEQLYVTPDDVYLKQITENGVTKYTVIGK